MAAVLAFEPDAVLSHRSAGRLWKVTPRRASLPEVTVSRDIRLRPGLIRHCAPLSVDEITEIDRIPVTSIFRTIFDLAGVLTLRELERAFHEAEVRELRDRLSLWDLLERYPGRRGAANLRAVLGVRTPVGITRNELEERFVVFLDARGLPRPLLNRTLSIRGRLLEPDCMWPDQRLIVELDGGAVHRTERNFQGDRKRDRILLAEGWRSARVTWAQLRDEPEAIAVDLHGLLATGA
jgi:very-short-patch-repair endonuclease